MDDFILNFDTSNPAAAAKKAGGGKQKGGRWTDRARDKRRDEGAARRDSRPAQAPKVVVPASESAPVVLGKRERTEEVVRPASGVVGGADRVPSTEMIRPRIQRPAASASAAPSTGAYLEGGGQSGKTTMVNGKKHYISSLFTAEGLPVTSSSASTKPIIPSRPSNAPLTIAPVEEVETIEEDADLPSPAPALTALGLLPALVSHLHAKLSLQGPTACQAISIPPLLPPSSSSSITAAHDVILQAQTGSGKTLAFLLPMLQDLLTLPPSIFPSGAGGADRSVGTLALILAPTRELAAQIFAVLETLLSLPSSSAFTTSPRALTPCLLVGGANRTHEKRRLRKGCPIIVATPGRLLDHLRTTESFRFAGEAAPTKGPRGRGSGATGPTGVTGSNGAALGGNRRMGGGGIEGRPLGLRWLVVDECDRLMDLGFEEQMKGVLDEIERRSPSANVEGAGRRRTVLCSATASEGVDRLAGMALRSPVVLRADTVAGGTEFVVPAALIEGEESYSTAIATKEPGLGLGEDKISFTPPTQLVHNYVVCPPKLRFVALVALLRRILKGKSTAASKSKGTKVVVFLSCTAAVDFYWEAMGSLTMGSAPTPAPVTNVLESTKDRITREKAEEEKKRKNLTSLSSLLPNVPIYRLHGNLELGDRMGSLKGFSGAMKLGAEGDEGETRDAVLFCTSVAARGLDVPGVGHVVQYDLPTEGGVTEYIHRVGRTARAGASGQATAFLLPEEKSWVPWVETGMRDGASRGVKDVKLRELGVEDVLMDGFGGVGREYETRATDVQMGFERWVGETDENSTLARNAFASHIRAYATHPSTEKSMFNTKALHLGHLAKAFGMREAPGRSAGSQPKKSKSVGRVSTIRTLGRPQSEREQADRAIASLPARATGNRSGGFETGRRHDEERAMGRLREDLMKGPTGDGAGEFQIASVEMLDSLAKAQGAGGSKRKR